MAAAGRHLFVYGTLMGRAEGDFGRAQRERLHREARSLGAATAPGDLYDLGSYPGLKDSDGCGLVHGELLLLAEPEATFLWLDDYEGVDQEAAEPGEYRRLVRDVRLAGGERIAAWTYVYMGSTLPAQRLAGGRWPA